MRGFRWAVAALAVAAGPLFAAEDVRVGAGTVEDTRASDGRFGGVSIELKLEGALAQDVKALRVKVKSAKDDQGTNLWKPEPDAAPKSFEEFSPDRSPKPKLALGSPARGASRIDVVGEVELFVPKRDPGTAQKVPGFLAKRDRPIASPALKSAKVELTPLSAAEYKSRMAKSRPTKDQIVAEGKKRGASDKEIEEMVQLMEALASLGGSEEPDENSVLFEVKDPEGRLLGVDLLGKDGEPLSAQMRSSSGGLEKKTMKLSYAQKPPADATLLLTLRTPKSVVTVPLEMKGVALP